MKNLILIIFSCLIVVSCSEDGGGGTEPDPEVNFEPTGFTLTYNDSVYAEYQNGEYVSDADTIRLNWYLGERTFDINFMDKDGKFYENVDPLDYQVIVNVTNRNRLQDPIVFGAGLNFSLSLTPHDEGITHFQLQVSEYNDDNIFFSADSLFVEIHKNED